MGGALTLAQSIKHAHTTRELGNPLNHDLLLPNYVEFSIFFCAVVIVADNSLPVEKMRRLEYVFDRVISVPVIDNPNFKFQGRIP